MQLKPPGKHPFRNIAILGFAFATMSVFVGAAVQSLYAPGDLDPTFGSGGKVTTPIGKSYATANALAIQPDGKMVAAGYGNNGSNSDFALVRYNPNGSLDMTFDSDGKVTTPIGTSNDYAEAIAIQQDGKIVAAGRGDNGSNEVFALVRYNTDGSLDTTFDSDGKVTTPVGIGARPYALAIQPDGKIVAAGFSSIGPTDSFALVRYNTNGSLDTSFDGDGKVTTPIGTSYAIADALAIQPDGKIVAAGTSHNGSNWDLALVRYNTNGSLDTTFDSDGKVTTHIIGPQHDLAEAVVIQPDGKVVAAGYTYYGPVGDFVLVRYNTDGSLDPTFGSGGVVTTDINFNSDAAHAAAIQQDGKILAAGGNYNGSNLDFSLVRYTTDGSLDATFGGGDGISTVDFNNRDDLAHGMALDSLGRAVVVGESDGRFAIARFTLDLEATAFDYDGDRRADLSVRRLSDNVWHLLRATAGYTAMEFGVAGDRLTPADFDGDGKTDVAVFRPSNGTWYVYMSQSQTFQAFGWGQDGDLPVPTDRDNDGKTDLVIFRPSNNTWYTRFANGTFAETQFGVAGDKPVVGDFDADGKGDLAVFRPNNNNWYIIKSSLGFFIQTWGEPGDIPITGDFDGDGATDQAVFRPSTGQWFKSQTSAGFESQTWGEAGDIPVAADYDGDGKTDVAVFRPTNGTWYIVQSTAGILIQQFGQNGDVPTQSAFLY